MTKSSLANFRLATGQSRRIFLHKPMQRDELMFSVAVPVRNGKKYLETCLESVRRQDVAPNSWQCICVDDGSTDGGEKILDKFASADGRFIVLKNVGSGVGAARNVAIKAASGKFIAFLDCDDLLEPQFLGELGELAEKFSAEIVGCCHGNFFGYGKPPPRAAEGKCNPDGFLFTEPLKSLLGKNKKTSLANGLRNYFVWGRLFRREFLLKNNLLFSPIAIGEDTLFSLQTFSLASRFAISEKILCWHRRHGESTMGSYHSIDYMENCIAVAVAASEWFTGLSRETDGETLQLTQRAINKIVYEGCIRGRRGVGYWSNLATRRRRLKALHKSGFFDPKALFLRHRIRSEIFLKFGL